MKKITLTFLLCLAVSISFSQSKIWKTTSEKGEFQGHSIEKLDANNSAVLALDFVAFQQQLEFSSFVNLRPTESWNFPNTSVPSPPIS